MQENVGLKNGMKVVVDCGYSNGANIKFAEDEKIDLYAPNRAQAQKFDGREQTIYHDDYIYNKKKNELVIDGERYRFRGVYERKNGKKISAFYSEKLKKKREVPFFFKERLRMKEKMEMERGKEIYDMRKIVIKSVIGNIKENFGFRYFLVRGLNGAKLKLNLVSIVHNLKKIWILRGKMSTNNSEEIKNINFCLTFIENYLNCETACLGLTNRGE